MSLGIKWRFSDSRPLIWDWDKGIRSDLLSWVLEWVGGSIWLPRNRASPWNVSDDCSCLGLNFWSSTRIWTACVFFLGLLLTGATQKISLKLGTQSVAELVSLYFPICKMDTVLPTTWRFYEAQIKTVGAKVLWKALCLTQWRIFFFSI